MRDKSLWQDIYDVLGFFGSIVAYIAMILMTGLFVGASLAFISLFYVRTWVIIVLALCALKIVGLI